MGFVSKDDKPWRSAIRAIKTVFFLIAMFFSFLFFSAPVLLVIADALLPSALLSALPPTSTDPTNSRSSFSVLLRESFFSYMRDYDFRYSLVDIPVISIVRSILILCVYSWCDGPRRSMGPYLWVATACSLVSLGFLSLKASFVFGSGRGGDAGGYGGGREAEVALFCSSYALAVGHVLVAYRTSCRERKKLLVYKIDIEAVSSYKNGFLLHQKALQQERIKK